MPKFVFAYHGGDMPETEAEQQQAMAAWGGWITKYESVFADTGNPVGKSVTVSASGVVNDGGSNPLSGYGIVDVADLDTAVAIAKECPIMGEGGSIEIASVVEIEGM